VHFDTVLEANNWHLERCQNRQTGMSALRRAGFPACRFWGLSSPQSRTVSKCTPNRFDPELRLDGSVAKF
jgi:hypothetical protein